MDLGTRLLIYGFSRSVSAEDVSTLLGPACGAVVEMVLVPGDNDEAIAVVQLSGYRPQAFSIAGRLKARRYRGRQLQPWVPVMAWS
jgi:hypothetical protein